jgi:Fe-S cluster biogenesis protein NfuA
MRPWANFFIIYYSPLILLVNGGYAMKEEVRSAIERIRPNLQADGGDVELVDVDDEGIVRVKLLGACRGCPMSQMTLKMGIQKYLQKEVPGVKDVVSVT